MTPWYERGFEWGIKRAFERGILLGEQRSTLRYLEAKFGPLPPDVPKRVEALSLEQVVQLQLDLLKAQSLKELQLQE